MTLQMVQAGVHFVANLPAASARADAEAAGVTVFVLPEHGVVDWLSFAEAVGKTCPLDPPGSTGWDSLNDSLGGGLIEHGAKRFLLLWKNADAMALSAPKDFEEAVLLLSVVASGLEHPANVDIPTSSFAVLIERPSIVE